MLLLSGKVTVNAAPEIWIELVTSDQPVEGAKVVVVINFKAAPLNGHCNRRLELSIEALIEREAPIPPTASATGKTLPLASKNDAVLKPASLTPLAAWYSAPQ